MVYNYHTHTKMCKHAFGEVEDYIIRAIENGIKYMGFSDHIPLQFPDGQESGYRIPVCSGKLYCETIRELAKKYSDKIDIKVGFEMEFYPEYFDTMLENAKQYGGKYLILGQHFLDAENVAETPASRKTENTDVLKKYVDVVIEAMQKGVFTYVAHPDILNFAGDIDIYNTEMQRLCIASRELNIPLEINFLGIRDNRRYPASAFWEIAGKEKSPVTFGFDAHDVESAYDGASLEVAKTMVRKHSLNYIGKPDLILL